MTFQEQIIATSIGAFLGFVSALFIFWIKEHWTQSRKDEALIKNLLYELDYNKNLFSKYSTMVTEAIEAVGSDNRSVFLNISYTHVASYFSQLFYREGLITKHLHPEDAKRWNDFIIKLSAGNENYVLSVIEKWRSSSISKEEVFVALKHERDQLNYAKEMTDYLQKKIKS